MLFLPLSIFSFSGSLDAKVSEVMNNSIKLFLVVASIIFTNQIFLWLDATNLKQKIMYKFMCSFLSASIKFI